MNNLTGLQKRVFHQGYHLRIPFIEVLLPPRRPPSSTTPVSVPSTSTSPLVPRTCRPSPSLSVSCSSRWRRNCQRSTSCWARTTRRRSSTRSARRSCVPSSPSVRSLPLRRR
jgi:hypothetical protein